MQTSDAEWVNMVMDRLQTAESTVRKMQATVEEQQATIAQMRKLRLTPWTKYGQFSNGDTLAWELFDRNQLQAWLNDTAAAPPAIKDPQASVTSCFVLDASPGL